MRSKIALLLLALPSLVVLGCRSSAPPPASCACADVLAASPASCDPAVARDLPRLEGIENLVFEGGGVKGTAYAGALEVLEARGVLDTVRRVAGTSAGSITALLVALGYDAEETRGIVLALDYERFREGGFFHDVERLFDRYGWYEGAYATCLFECLVERKLGSRDATFADLHARTAADPRFKDLYVVATNLDRNDWVVFSHEDPRFRDLPLAAGVRASMSIPLYFTAQRIAGETFVDGGVVHNYPIDVFSGGGPPGADTLGFFLGGRHEGREITNLRALTESVFKSLVAVQIDDVCRDPAVVARTVFIDPLGIHTTDFELTGEQKCALIRSGVAGTEAYFREPATECPERVRRASR